MGAIPGHSTDTTRVEWDGAANEARLSNGAGASTYRRAFAWVDSTADPDVKASYRFIHHMVSADGTVGAANTVACSSGIGVLNGGRGGTTIPSADLAGVHAHLARHLEDAGLNPPALTRSRRKFQHPDPEESSMSTTPLVVAERRYTPVVVEVRATSGRRRIGGYASIFNVLSRNLGGFVERVEGSFFNKSRADGWPEVICRYNHDDNMLLGTTGAQTLDLRLDETGLYYEVEPPQSRSDILELVSRGDVRKSSFAFRVPPGGDEWSLTDQGYPMRSLVTGHLVDVAPVNSPAYEDTTVGLRSLAEHFGAEIEEVKSLAEQDELRKFFVRTSGPSFPAKKTAPPRKRLFGPAAAAALLAREQDPWVDAG